MVRRRTWVGVGLVFLAGCASIGGIGDDAALLRERDTIEGDHCSLFWSELTVEWLEANGGSWRSIDDLKKSTATDRTRLGAIIRNTWRSQQPVWVPAAYSWPISHDLSRHVVNLKLEAGDRVPVECELGLEMIDAINYSMYAEGVIYGTKAKPIEAPEDLEWESPFAAQWVWFWILVAPRDQ